MRLFAILASLVQIVLILATFFSMGLQLGGQLILLLFILLIIAVINLFALLLCRVKTASDPPLIAKQKPQVIKRQDLRVAYREQTQPALIVGPERFAVIDLAENGVRIRLDRRQRLKKRISGIIELKDGSQIPVKGRLSRREADEAAFKFKKPIEYQTLLKEKHAIPGN
jgi:hypothetical protein